jgi:hypothetical protein
VIASPAGGEFIGVPPAFEIFVLIETYHAKPESSCVLPSLLTTGCDAAKARHAARSADESVCDHALDMLW